MSFKQRLANFFLPQHTVSEVFFVSFSVVFTLALLVWQGFPFVRGYAPGFWVGFFLVVFLVFALFLVTSGILFFQKGVNSYSLQFIQIVGGIVISVVGVLYIVYTLSNINFGNLTPFHYFVFFYAFVHFTRFLLSFVRYGRPRGYVDIAKRMREMRSAKHVEIHPLWLMGILIISSWVYFVAAANLIAAVASSFYVALFCLDIVEFITKKNTVLS